jgi:hypothetical protein
VNRFDVSVHAIRRRAGRRRPFEVRWQAAGRSRSKSFTTKKLADSYRAELVRAARMGLEFDPLTGEPTEWHISEPAVVTWHEEATAYAVMKWPSLGAPRRPPPRTMCSHGRIRDRSSDSRQGLAQRLTLVRRERLRTSSRNAVCSKLMKSWPNAATGLGWMLGSSPCWYLRTRDLSKSPGISIMASLSGMGPTSVSSCGSATFKPWAMKVLQVGCGRCRTSSRSHPRLDCGSFARNLTRISICQCVRNF